MSATFKHFAINADDVPRARKFYEDVFGWRFASWGPPNFYQTRSAGEGIVGAIQERRNWGDIKSHTFETTFGVDDIRAVLAKVEQNGGRVLFQPFRIEGVGEIAYFQDSEGNICGVGQYDDPTA